MLEQTPNGCPPLTGNHPRMYKRMLDNLRVAGADHAWTNKVSTGNLSCWTIGQTVVLVQQIGSGVEVYTNILGPNTWDEIPGWLETL